MVWAIPTVAKAFLEPEGSPHDPLLLGDMAAAVERLGRRSERGERICVHGDYDVDGICSTALAVLTLRELGADVGWHLPSRFEEGYGVSARDDRAPGRGGRQAHAHRRLRDHRGGRGGGGRRLGVDMIVTDHHRPGDTLPNCPIVATRPSDYPFPDLCGTGVVVKLPQALLGAGRSRDRAAPGSGRACDDRRRRAARRREPRSREHRPAGTLAHPEARAARAHARRRRRSGHRRRDGRRLRLAPRLNAAGRLGRPDVGAASGPDPDDAARQICSRTSWRTLNRDRQAVEERILREAVAVVDDWPAEKRSRRAYVVWGEGWHEGVIGIVASRLVERFGRPVVLIAGEGDSWKGSGRSVPSFDLHAGLAACSDHLERSAGIVRPPG